MKLMLGRRQTDGGGVIQAAGHTLDRHLGGSQVRSVAGLQRERAATAGACRVERGSHAFW